MLSQTKTIAIIGALDTKGEDFAFVEHRVKQHGFQTLLLDFGVLGAPSIPADISREMVAEAAGARLEDMAAKHDRGMAVTAMTRGATKLILELFEKGHIHGIMGMGGGAGTTVSTAIMRELPLGFPKLIVSTLAANSNMQPYIRTSDIVMMPSVVDVAGLNRISRLVYSRAADAICGMLHWNDGSSQVSSFDTPLVVATMFGNTTPCVTRAKQILEQAGIEVLVFHANGGGQTMEHLIDEGLVDGVLDLTTTELADELVGGVRSAGPDRLMAAARKGLPQVVSVGALDMVNFGTRDTIPQRFADRLFHSHNAQTTLMRTTPEESTELGQIIARKLNSATGPVVLLLPTKGISSIDALDEPFCDPEARQALFAALRTHVEPQKVTVLEVDSHINDPTFADFAVATLMRLMDREGVHGQPATYSH